MSPGPPWHFLPWLLVGLLKRKKYFATNRILILS